MTRRDVPSPSVRSVPAGLFLLLVLMVGLAVPSSRAEDDGGRSGARNAGLLVIADPSLAAGSAGLKALIAFRRAQGFDVTAVDLNTTGGTAASIDAYITNAWNTWVVPPSFLLLVGDTNTIPCWTGTGTGNPPTDLDYADVNGDRIPDIMTGRLPVRSVAALDNLCAKMAALEISDSRTAAFLAGIATWQKAEQIHDFMAGIFVRPAGWTPDKLYSHTYGAGTADVASAINAGRAVVCFAGDGDESAWLDGPPFTGTDVRALTNALPPLVVSFGTRTGNFSVAECFGETWLRARHGAAAFLGQSGHTYLDLTGEFELWLFDALFSGARERPLGEAVAYAQLQLTLTSSYAGPDVQAVLEMMNLLGDPTMEIPIGARPPRPDIRVNGADRALAVPKGTPAFLTIGLDPASALGVSHDWWVSVKGPAPSAVYWYTPAGWSKSLTPVRGYGGPLVPIASKTLSTSSTLPRGVYLFTFSVDLLNNTYEGTFTDHFTLRVK